MTSGMHRRPFEGQHLVFYCISPNECIAYFCFTRRIACFREYSGMTVTSVLARLYRAASRAATRARVTFLFSITTAGGKVRSLPSASLQFYNSLLSISALIYYFCGLLLRHLKVKHRNLSILQFGCLLYLDPICLLFNASWKWSCD